jgi:enoyl-CoA hydratase/carnithine racemase
MKPCAIPSEESTPFLVVSFAEDVFTFHFQTPETRFSTTTVGYINEALDLVEKYINSHMDNPPKALLTTSNGKIYSNGLDLDEMMSNASDSKLIDSFFINHLHPLYERMLLFPIPTIACINGHCYAGGLLFALCHDYRTMRKDRGFLCLNEVELPGPLQPGMAAVVKAKVKEPSSLRDIVLCAKRLDSKAAMSLGLIEFSAAETELYSRTVGFAKDLPKLKSPLVYQLLKRELYAETVERLRYTVMYNAMVGFGNVASKL